MKIVNDFELSAPPEDVYGFMLDLEEVAGCIPGAEIGEEADDGTRAASVTVMLGPMRFVYEGTVEMLERREADGFAKLATKMRDSRGQGTANAEMEMVVEAAGEGAKVRTTTELQLTGRAAQMGHGVIEDVATKMVEDMVGCIDSKLSSGDEQPSAGDASAQGAAPRPASEPIRGSRVVVDLARIRIRRLWARARDWLCSKLCP